MSTFRERGKKKCILDKRLTITAKHEEMIRYFRELDDSIPDRESEINEIKKRIRSLNRLKKKDPEEYFIVRGYVFKLEDMMDKKNTELKKIRKKEEETAYFQAVLPLLMEYSKIVDLGLKTDKTRSELWREYMEIVDMDHVRINSKYEKYICPDCEIDCHEDQFGTVICHLCGFIVYEDDIMDEPGYKDADRYDQSQPFVYKRINHFNEWLSQFQAKETTDIPPEVYQKIIDEFRKYRIRNLGSLKPDTVKRVLKRIGPEFTKYYEHVPHIICKLNGLPAPFINQRMEEKLRAMFREIQEPFEKYKPNDRKNFLSYSYVLHKFFELLEMDDFLDCFPLLKDTNKLRLHDEIFEKICKDLKWQFIKSV